jgi:DNA-binding MarR family transcriptional regulator
MGETERRSNWVFLSNHGYALLCIARDPQIRIWEIARHIGIGERAAQKIVADLVADGYLARTKEGRRNRYEVNPDAHLRHPLFEDARVGLLLDALQNGADGRALDEPT